MASPQILTSYGPGTASTVTQAPSFAPGASSDLTEFYKELMRRKAATSSSPPPASKVNGGSSRGIAAPMPMMAAAAPPTGSLGSSDMNAHREDLAEQAYRARLRQIDLNPPKKLVGFGPQQTPGYVDDVSALPLSLRPSNAGIAHGPASEAKARLGLADDSSFYGGLEDDRARVRNTSIGNPNEAPVNIAGTAPMLTPSNAAVPSRKLTPEEAQRQRMTNAGYGR